MITTGRALALAIADAYEQRPDTWCQGPSAMNAEGLEVMADNPEACRFCAQHGAPRRAVDVGKATLAAKDAYHRLWAVDGSLFVAIGERQYFWNDVPGRTVAEVVAKLCEIGGAG